MLRRSRISVRPNVRPAGRGPAPASSQDTPPSQEAQAAVSEDLPQAGGQCVKDTTTTAVLEASTESTTPREDGKDPNGEASSSTPSAGLQRRKRFSVMPNLAKPRVAATPALTRSSPRTPKSPVKAGTETPAPTPEAPSQPDSGPPQGMRSPRRRPSGGSRQAKGQPKPRPLSPASPGPTTTSLGNVAVENSSSSQQTPQAPGEGSIQSDLLKKTPIIKVPSSPLEMVPSSSLPDKEGISVSERAKTLVARSVSGGLTGLAPGKSRLSRFLNDPTDLQRLAKARKLRELLRQEMNKEKKRSKAKVCVSEYTLDPSKMTMRDLIYYLPDTNPMTSYLVEEQRENETVLPLTPPREESPERPPTPEAPAEIASQGDEDVDEDEDDDGVMVPRVKVAEDGSLIIDEESLTVEVLRQKGPNPADDRDPIFERGSTTTYSSFRKGTHVKPWSNKETDMFFLAISMVGTDFSMIGQLFPHRGRTEIKNKFKKEERANSWRIDKAFKEKRRLDHEFFTSLLEKILAAEAKRNKNNKSPTEKIRIKKKIKQKEKKAAKQLSDVEEEGLDAEMDTEEVEGEKENENVSNEGTTLSSAPTPKRKRKSRDGGGESSPEEAKDGKKKKIDLITSDQEEAGVPEDSEAGPPESSKQAEEPVEAAKGPVVIKPAQLSRGRSQRPLPNLGRKWGQRGPEPNTKPNVKDGATPTEEENTEEGLSEEQVDKDASPSVSQKEKKKAGKLSSSEEEEEEASDKPIKPTRYGRIPKKTQLLNYPAKEDGDSPSDSAPTPASDGSPSTMPKSKPATRRAKIKPGPALPGRMGQSAARKSKLVTLRASQSEDEDEDEEEVAWREEAQAEEDTHNPTSPEEENQAPAFIPMSLRSPQPVATEVEETMEELDISVNVPDVLGISHDAFCPDSSCERAHAGEMGTVPCEHQLDLLVDVIDFLSPDNMEVSEESYNEAARTLLAIGNLTHLSQAAEAFTAGADDIITEERSNEDQLYQMTPQPTDQSQTSTIPSEYLRVTEASRIAEDSVPVASSTTASVPVTTTTASIPGSKITACVIITTATASVPVTTTTSSPPVTLTTTASIRVTTSTASVPLPQSSDTPDLETPPIEGPLRQMEGTDIGHASKMESGSEVSEGSEQQTTSQNRRSHFPKVKPNLGRAARTTKPKQTTTTLSEPTQTTTTLSEPPQTTTTLSEPPLEPMLNITTTSEPQPSMIITIEPPLPTESINTESETQPKQRTTTHSKSQTTTTHSKHQPTTNIIPHSGPQPSQRTRVAHSKPQPTLNTTTQSEPPQPTLNSTTNTLSKQQSTQSTTILSQPQPTSSLEQPGPVTLRPIVPESPLTSSEEVKGHDGRKGNTSSSLSVGGSQSGTSDSDQPKQTGPLTRRARLPKPKPNLGCTAKAATRSAVQVPESRPSPEVQTPEEADEVPIEIQQIHQVFPLCDIIDTTQEEIQQIHQVIPHPPIEGPLRQREGTDIGHASQVESGSEVSESSEQQTTSQSRRSHFPKVKPNLGRAARTTQPKQTTTTLSEPPQTTTTLSEPPQTTTTLSEPPQTTTTLSEPQPIQRTRGVHSKPQPALNTTTQSEPPQPTLNSSTNTLSKQQSTQNTTILSQPQPTSSLEQPGPVTLRPIVPESPLRSSEEVKGHDGPKENSSSSFSAGGSQSATSDSEQPKQTGTPTRRARLPKPKPNLGLTARAATRSAVQVPESRPSTEVQTPEEADEVPMEIQQIHQVSPLCDIIDTTQEEMEQIHQVISLTDVIDSTQGDMSVFTEGSFFSQQCDAVFIQHSETSVSTAPLDQTQSDPDEPIFILSLTEIPVLPAGEESGCTSQTLSEPFLFLPDAGTQLQQSSDIVAPGGGLEKGNAGVLCEVPEPMSVDEVLPQPSYTSIKEVESGSTAGPVGVCASAKPSEDSMADAVSEDTHPPKKRKAPERARRVDKLQVRPNTAVREQTSCSAPAKEAVSPITPDQTPSLTTTTLDTYHLTASSPLAQPGPTVTGTASQQGTVGCFDRTETEHTPTGGEDNSSGAESQAARQITPLAMSGPLSRPGRRPRGFLSFMSNKNASPVAVPPRGTRAAARRPQVNTTRPGGKRAAPEPSTTTRTMPSPSIMHYTTTPTRATRTTTKPDFSTRVTQEKPSDALALHSNPEPSTSLCTTATESSQVPAAQPSASPCVDSGSADEEPINVSQYFFSDIFTEVEENEG